MLTAEQIELFERQGFLLVGDVLDEEADLAPIVQEYSERLDELAGQLASEGRVSSTYSDLAFRDRMTAICRETGETFAQFFNISLPMVGVSEDTPFLTGPAVFALIRNNTALL